jgi:hypothetical protein
MKRRASLSRCYRRKTKRGMLVPTRISILFNSTPSCTAEEVFSDISPSIIRFYCLETLQLALTSMYNPVGVFRRDGSSLSGACHQNSQLYQPFRSHSSLSFFSSPRKPAEAAGSWLAGPVLLTVLALMTPTATQPVVALSATQFRAVGGCDLLVPMLILTLFFSTTSQNAGEAFQPMLRRSPKPCSPQSIGELRSQLPRPLSSSLTFPTYRGVSFLDAGAMLFAAGAFLVFMGAGASLSRPSR